MLLKGVCYWKIFSIEDLQKLAGPVHIRCAVLQLGQYGMNEYQHRGSLTVSKVPICVSFHWVVALSYQGSQLGAGSLAYQGLSWAR